MSLLALCNIRLFPENKVKETSQGKKQIKAPKNPQKREPRSTAGSENTVKADFKSMASLMQRIIDSFENRFYSLDRSYRYTGFNKSHAQSMKSLYGVDIQLGNSLLDYIDVKEDRKRAKINLDRVFDKGETVIDEVLIGKEPLSRKYLEISHTPLKDEKGSIVGVIITSRDMTLRKQWEDALRDSEERFRKVFEESPIGIVLTSRDFQFFNANPAFCRMLGYTADEMSSKTFLEVTHPEHRNIDKENVERMWREEIPNYITEKRYVAKNGDVRLGLLSASLIRGYDGKPLYALAMIDDITERKHAEENLLNSAIFLNNMVEQSPTPTWISDDKGNLLRINKACCELLNITQNEVIEKYNVFKDNIVEEQGHMPLVKNVFEKGEVARFELNWDSSKLKGLSFKNSTKVILSVTIFPIKNSSGKITNAVIQHMDITESKKSEILIRRQREEYRTIIDTIPAVIAYVDRDGKILRINKAGASDFGMKPKEAVGKTYHDLFPTEIANKYIKQVQRVMDTATPIMGTITHLTFASGKEIDVEADMLPYLDHEGKVIGVISLVQDITEKKKTLEALEQRNLQLNKTLNDAINAMVRIVELRDPYTAGHQQGVAKLAAAIANEMGLDEERVHNINMAARIHDIGKIYIPSDILSKPGTLSHVEYKLIQTHPVGGHDIISGIDFPFPVALTVLQHHERLDGSGYPNNLKVDEILLESKIVAVADVVEAMASYRPYRPALGIEKALKEIQLNKGIKYDETAVNACLTLFNKKGFQFME
jgi:PAS domain S-box-containing protein